LVEVAAAVQIQLPDVIEWIKQSNGDPATGFDRSITIKDIGGNAANFNIVVVPFGSQAIDNIQQAVVMSVARATLKLIPLIDMTGWAVDTASSGGGGGGGGGDVFKAGNNTYTGINTFQNTLIAPTMGVGDNSPNVATTSYVKSQGYLISSSLAPYALLFDPIFSGDPRAPTPSPGDNDTSIATTAFVQNALAGFTGGAPVGAEYITGSSNPTLTNERTLVDSASITWDKSVSGQIKANTTAGGGNVSNVGTPTNGQLAQWTSATTIQGIAPSSLGFAPIASPTFTGIPRAPTPANNDNDTTVATTAFVQANVANRQPLDADLTAISNLVGTNTIYYRSAPDIWSPVTFSGLTFSGGVLTASAGAPADAEYITASPNAVLTSERVLTDTPTITWDKSTPGLVKANAVTITVPAHGFTAYKNADQSIVKEVWTKILFPTTLYNNASLYDAVNSRYVPAAGECALVASVWADGLLPGSNVYLGIYKNGALFRFATANNTNGVVQVTCFDNANGTDYYEAWIFGYTTGADYIIRTSNNDATFFQGQQPMGPAGPSGTTAIAGSPANGQMAVFVNGTTITGQDVPPASPPEFTTGDVKLTYKTIADAGWVFMDDGSIGNALSNATTRANTDCQALFTLFWNNTTLPLRDSAGNSVTRGSSALNDWNSNRQMVLAKTLGRSLAGAGTGAGLTSRPLATSDGTETHTLSGTELTSHAHGIVDPGHVHYIPSGQYVWIAIGTTPVDNNLSGLTVSMPYSTSNINYVDARVTDISISAVGSNQPFSIMEPRAYLNIMVKL